MTDKQKEMACPVCGERDKIRFAFIEHCEIDPETRYLEISRNNPSDIYDLFMCPNNHVFDSENEYNSK